MIMKRTKYNVPREPFTLLFTLASTPFTRGYTSERASFEPSISQSASPAYTTSARSSSRASMPLPLPRDRLATLGRNGLHAQAADPLLTYTSVLDPLILNLNLLLAHDDPR